MGIPNMAGMLAGADGERAEVSDGTIHERTIELGATVISIDNIGSMTLVEGSLNQAPTVVSAIGVAAGLLLATSSHVAGLVVAAIAGFFLYLALTRKTKKYLSIGTSDGRWTHLVSTDGDALSGTRDFIRKKIDGRVHAVARIVNGNVSNIINVAQGDNNTQTVHAHADDGPGDAR